MSLAVKEGCDVCQHPLREDGSCGNPLCSWDDRAFDRNYAIARREGPLEIVLSRYKYAKPSQTKFIASWATILARILVGYLEEHHRLFQRFDLIVANPTFVGPAGRDWDHIRPILRQASILSPVWPFDIGDTPAVEKTLATRSMMGKSWRERKEIVDAELIPALRVPDPQRIKGKRLLIFDDIFTSGLTLHSVAGCLLEDGDAASISSITLARQLKKD